MKNKIKDIYIFIIYSDMWNDYTSKIFYAVENGTKRDYNQKSFWYYPWGKSITHKKVGDRYMLSLNKCIEFYSRICYICRGT